MLTLSTRFLYTLLVLLTEFPVTGHCQPTKADLPSTLTLTGTVLTIDRLPVDSCQVFLLRQDTTLVTRTVSTSNGQFTLRNLTSGSFLLRLAHPDFVTVAQDFLLTKATLSPNLVIVVHPKVIKLGEVSVKEKRPVFELTGDRIILNVDNNPVFAGGYVTDALSAAPRVSIDPIAKTVAVDGKTGILIYQNGRQLYLPADQIVGYLRSLPITSISRIEVLTNPPAQYDAGSSAVILLFTRRIFREGFTGEVSGTAGAGRYVKANGSLTLSLLTPKVEGSFLYTPGYNPTYFSWKSSQFITGTLPGETGFARSDQFNRVDYRSHILRTSWDWNISKTFTAGVVVQGTSIRSIDTPTSDLSYQLATGDAPVIQLGARTRLQEQITNGTVNLHARKQFADSRQSIAADFDVGRYVNQSTVNSNFTRLNSAANLNQLIQILYPGSVQIITAKADYTTTWPDKTNLDAGIKYSAIRMSNQPSTERLSSAFESIEPLLSSPYQYKEKTTSVYVNMDRNWTKWFLTAGLRAERTDYRGQSAPSASVERSYTNLFPTVSLRYTTGQKYQYGLSANRRIVRPAFDQLNPAFIFYDPLTLYSGNPLLVPQLTTTAQATMSTPKSINLTFVYTSSQNRIAEVVYRLDSVSATTLDRNINFDREKRIAVTLAIPWKPVPAWQVQTSLTGSHTQFYSTFQEIPTTNSQTTAVIRLNNAITLGKWTLNINATYRSKAVVGYMYYNPLWYLDLGVQRSLGTKSSIKFAASDVFHTLLITNYGSYLNTDITFRHRYESQRALFTFTHKFGNATKRVKERSFGSDAEQGRLGGQSRN